MIKLSLDECTQRIKRRAALKTLINEVHPDKKGALLIGASTEKTREPFYQDSAFFYYVGLEQPGVIFFQNGESEPVVYEPNYGRDRSVWVSESYDASYLDHLGISERLPLGEKISSYSLDAFSPVASYSTIVAIISQVIAQGDYLYIPLEDASDDVRSIIEKLCTHISGMREKIVDVSAQSAMLRRKKDQQELEYMYKAIEITSIAHEAAAGVIQPGRRESDVHAAINYIFTEGQAVPAFASIVGSGKNSTVLHYVANDQVILQGDVVVIDIGASYKRYCADVSRTYPVSGVFTQRQKEIYDIVLATQEYVAAMAKPGMWLHNPEEPTKSLHHLAREFLKEQGGYDVYMPHSIGHFVGLDVHDVGNCKIPLAKGDIITIEPGIYIPEERLGIRIEDMYWIVDGESVCLSDSFPKTTIELEELMRHNVVKDQKEQDVSAKNMHDTFLPDFEAAS